MKPLTQERRAHPRYPIGFGASVRFRGGEVPAATRDVSVGGCLLESQRPIPESASVAMSLHLTEDGIQIDALPPLRVRGTIRWTAEGESHGEGVYLSGVQFDSLTADQQRWLATVIERFQIT